MKTHLLTPLLALTFAAATSHAALITWGAATGVSGDTDVSTAGTLIDAINIGIGADNPTTTVNGVTFTAFNGFFGSTATFSIAGTGAVSPYPGAVGPFGALTSAYRDLLRDGARGFGFPLSISGLNVGETYQLQIWSSFSGAAGAGSTLTATTGANSVLLDSNLPDVEGGLGQYVLGTFVADSTSQTVSFNSVGIGILNAAQLRSIAPASVPEPGTALAGVMLAGLVGLRRRRMAAAR